MIDVVPPQPARAPEREELARLVVRARRLAGWYVRRQRIPPEDGEDLVQQTLLVLVVKYREVRHPDAWVLGTLRNKCRQYWKAQRDVPLDGLDARVLDAVLPPLPPDQERSDLRRDLELALARLPARCREILRYRYGLGLRAQEIADRLDCPAANVRKIASRSLRALQRELAMGQRD